MAENETGFFDSDAGRKLFVAGGIATVALMLLLGYIGYAFPGVRCEAVKHLDSPEKSADCYKCHREATPKIAQHWYESKHGVTLVKCYVCHGQPGREGSIPFAVNPDVDTTCRKCHDPSIKKMEARFGLNLRCNQCHPFHQDSIHHQAYEKPVAKKTIE